MVTVRVALLGARHVHVADHLSVLDADPAVELVTVYEPGVLSAPATTGCHRASTLTEALSAVDVAVVDSTTAEHAEFVPAVAEAGVAMFVEKPLAGDAARCRALGGVIENHPVAFANGLFLRCLSAMRRLREQIADAALGTLTGAHAAFTHLGLLDGVFTGNAAWMLDPSQEAVGGFADLGLHLIDALRWLRPGTPLLPRGAQMLSWPGGPADLPVGGTALLDWGGIPATVHASWVGAPGGLLIQIEGTQGSATVTDGELILRTDRVSVQPGPPPAAGAALAAFLAQLRGEQCWDPSTVDDAIATAEILDKISTLAFAGGDTSQ